ncbi:MAG: hypothetical protein DRP66_00300 [Planctomycetota bacterium]|nr:MAG: hypothetical protein DRP66_00300 [Planctomycetota bacterium]
MKKVVITLIIGIVIGISLTTLSSVLRNPKQPRNAPTRTVQETVHPKPETVHAKTPAELENLPKGAIVFDLSYAGLTDGRYGSYWGFGRSRNNNDSSFIKEVRKKAGEIQVIENRYFPEARLSAVEMLDNKAQALYFDLDQNGKLSDNEKILPLTPKPEDNSSTVDFMTPDFDLKTQEGRTVRFRTLARVSHRGSDGNVNIDVMWSPACILQGSASIDGEPARLTLFTNGFNGRFDRFGRGRYSLVKEKDYELEMALRSRQTLSSLINYNGRFYRLKILGSNEKGKVVKAALVEDTSPRGTVALNIEGDNTLKTKLERATINGKSDKTIYFNISGGQTELPEGDYVLSRGQFKYRVGKARGWKVDFSRGPEFVITPDKETVITMGKPAMSIRAVDNNKRYNSDVKPQKSFTKGARIYIEPTIKGMAGEVYGRFTEWKQRTNKKTGELEDKWRWSDSAPHIVIVDPGGKEFVSKKMEYG